MAQVEIELKPYFHSMALSARLFSGLGILLALMICLAGENNLMSLVAVETALEK